MKNNNTRGPDTGSNRSTLTFEEIKEILEEEIANCEISDDDFVPLNFDGEANRK